MVRGVMSANISCPIMYKTMSHSPTLRGKGGE